MKIEFSDDEIEKTQKYFFWRRITNRLFMESPSSRSDLAAQFLLDQYGLVLVEFNDNNNRSLRLRSVECPDETESFLRLKYESFR